MPWGVGVSEKSRTVVKPLYESLYTDFDLKTHFPPSELSFFNITQ